MQPNGLYNELAFKGARQSLRSLRLLALDPGETTGVCFTFQGEFFVWQEETKTLDAGIRFLISTFKDFKPSHLVFESYHIYQNKVLSHTFSEVYTIQFIGCIKTLCLLYKIPYSSQTAAMAKGFFTDEKLDQFALPVRGMRHGKDALRHAAYFHVFSKV